MRIINTKKTWSMEFKKQQKDKSIYKDLIKWAEHEIKEYEKFIKIIKGRIEKI